MPQPTQLTNLLFGAPADIGVFSDAGGTTPSVVGGPVRRINNLGSMGGQIGVNFPEELKLGQDSAEEGGRRYFTNATVRNANGGGDLTVVASGLSGPRTFALFIRPLPTPYTDVVFLDFGGGFDALTTLQNGEVRFQLAIKPGLLAPYLPKNALQVLVLSFDGNIAKSYVNGLLRDTIDVTGVPLTRFLVSCANMRVYMPLVYGLAADAGLLAALQTDAQNINKQATYEIRGNSHAAPNASGATSPEQGASNRKRRTLEAALASVGVSLIFTNRAVGGQDDAATKTDWGAEVSVASPWLGPSFASVIGYTNSAPTPGTIATGEAAADFFNSIGPVAKAKQLDKVFGTTPTYNGYAQGAMAAINARILANMTGGVAAYDAIHDLSGSGSGTETFNGSLRAALFPDGIHRCNNEQAREASVACPALLSAAVAGLPSSLQATALAKKPVVTGVVIASDRLSITVSYDMPVAIRNPAAYGKNGSDVVVSPALTASDFANNKLLDGTTANPITYHSEYQQATGFALVGLDAAGNSITNAVTPPDAINTIKLTFAQALPANGAGFVSLNYAASGNVKNHLRNGAADSFTPLVSGVAAPIGTYVTTFTKQAPVVLGAAIAGGAVIHTESSGNITIQDVAGATRSYDMMKGQMLPVVATQVVAATMGAAALTAWS